MIDGDGVRSLPIPWLKEVQPRLCIFEFAYIARPDSKLYGREVHETRCRMGELLAAQAPAEADLVMGVPESGVPAAEGFARASGIPYGQGLVKNRYIGRSFIAPDQQARGDAVRRKLNPLPETIAGKRLVVVDDSIVRGTTQRSVVRMLREAGATEVHLRISSPPWRWPCFYGIDTPSTDELLAANHSIEEITEILGADSLAYISVENLKAAIGADGGFCDACFTGDYPTAVPTSTPVLFTAPARSRWRIRRTPRGLTAWPRTRRRWEPGSAASRPAATYAGAGVDIGAGDLAVERMKGLVPGIGGFGGQFPLDTTRFTHPVLVSSTDGVGTKLMVAQATGRYGTVGIDLVAMCVDDLVCLGAEPLFMLDYIATGKVDPDRIATVVAGIARGLPAGRLRADRRRDGRAPRGHGARRPRHRRLRRGRGGAGAGARARAGRAGDVIVGLPSPGLRSNGYTLARHVLLERAGRQPGRPGLGRGRPTRWPTSCCGPR